MSIDQRVIRLRPHHIVSFFLKQIFMSEEQVNNALKEGGYSQKMIDNYLNVTKQVFQEGAPMLLVPSLDDICEECNRKDVEPGMGCSEPEPLYFERLEYGVKFGMQFGGVYSAFLLVSKLKRHYEYHERLMRKHHNPLGNHMQLELSAYRQLYNVLKQKRSVQYGRA